MNWREAVITRLADGEWYLAGQVFSQIETAIPMHVATRRMAHRRMDNVVLISDLDDGRWICFARYLSDIQVSAENRGPKRSIEPNTTIRLKPSGGCPGCDGPVFRKSAKRVKAFCPACGGNVLPAIEKLPMTAEEMLYWAYGPGANSPDGDRVTRVVDWIIDGLKPFDTDLAEAVEDIFSVLAKGVSLPAPPPPAPPPKPKGVIKRKWEHSRIWRAWSRREKKREALTGACKLRDQALEAFCYKARYCEFKSIVLKEEMIVK